LEGEAKAYWNMGLNIMRTRLNESPPAMTSLDYDDYALFERYIARVWTYTSEPWRFAEGGDRHDDLVDNVRHGQRFALFMDAPETCLDLAIRAKTQAAYDRLVKASLMVPPRQFSVHQMPGAVLAPFPELRMFDPLNEEGHELTFAGDGRGGLQTFPEHIISGGKRSFARILEKAGVLL